MRRRRLEVVERPAAFVRRLPQLLLWFALALGACDGSDPVVVDDPRVAIEELLGSTIVVTLNPSGIVPLSATVVFASTVPVQVELRVLGPDPLGNLCKSPLTRAIL